MVVSRLNQTERARLMQMEFAKIEHFAKTSDARMNKVLFTFQTLKEALQASLASSDAPSAAQPASVKLPVSPVPPKLDRQHLKRRTAPAGGGPGGYGGKAPKPATVGSADRHANSPVKPTTPSTAPGGEASA